MTAAELDELRERATRGDVDALAQLRAASEEDARGLRQAATIVWAERYGMHPALFRMHVRGFA